MLHNKLWYGFWKLFIRYMADVPDCLPDTTDDVFDVVLAIKP